MIPEYWEQQKKVEDDVFKRCVLWKQVSVGFLQRRMKHNCVIDKPAGFDLEKDKFGPRWHKGFMKRREMSLNP